MGGICSPFQLSDLSFNSVPRPPSARRAQANRRWPCLQKLRGTLIRGAETCKSISREGFNMESLEEVLISLGIGGMTSQFAQILQSAFGSPMVPPYVAKRESRIELHVKVEYPDKQGRLQILDINTRNMRQAFVLDEDVNLQEIACRTMAVVALPLHF